MRRVGVLLIIAGLLFGAALAGIIANSRTHVSLLVILGGPLTAAAEIVVGCRMLADRPRPGPRQLSGARPRR